MKARLKRSHCRGKIGSVDFGLLTVDIELKCGTVGPYIYGNWCTHHEGQVDVVMSSWEAANDRNVVSRKIGVEHRFDAFVFELVAAADERSKDDPFATVEYAVHGKDVELTVDVVHRFSYFLDKEDDVFSLGGIGLSAKVGSEGAKVAAN